MRAQPTDTLDGPRRRPGAGAGGHAAVAAAGALLAASSLLGVAPARAVAPELDVPERRDGHAAVGSPVWLEHRLAFRVRPELLVGGGLGPGASGVLPPLTTTARNGGGDDDTLAWASLRLRWEGTVHVGSPWAIHLGLDALDNLLLGSTPDFGRDRADAPLAFASGGQAPAEGGGNAWRSALRVRYLYGAWRAFDALDVAVGRMTDRYGVGLLRNRGDCDDCDGGTYVDGVRVGLELSGFRFDGSWEFNAVGATTERPGEPGQPLDLGRVDDVRTFTVRFASDGAALPAPARTAGGGAVALDWSLFSSFTSQDLSSSEVDTALLSSACQPEATTAVGDVALAYDCVPLVPRDAFLWRPGAWVRLVWQPDLARSVRAELELGGVIGDIGNTQRQEDLEGTKKDLRAFGGALELEVRTPTRGLGLDAGFATGDDRRYLGVLDGQNVVEPEDALYPDNENVNGNRVVTSYWFHRDYRLDLILFRQVIGAVTNAIYVKPWVSTTLLDTEDLRLLARLDVLYAAAAKPEGTPGRGRHYGVELDGRLTAELPRGFGVDVTAGLLLPMDALRDRDTGASPDAAFGVRGLLTWRY